MSSKVDQAELVIGARGELLPASTDPRDDPCNCPICAQVLQHIPPSPKDHTLALYCPNCRLYTFDRLEDQHVETVNGVPYTYLPDMPAQEDRRMTQLRNHAIRDARVKFAWRMFQAALGFEVFKVKLGIKQLLRLVP